MNSLLSRFRRPEQALLALSLALGLHFWFLQGTYPPALNVTFKWLPIGLLALVAWGRRRQPGAAWVVGAVLLHSVGDIVLGLNREWILFAIPPFLVGHLLYSRAFWPWRDRWQALPGARKALAPAAVVFSAVMAFVLIPNLSGVMIPAVAVYIAVITAMAVLAAVGRGLSPLVAAGALAYLVSDALIGINAFVTPVPGEVYIVWPLYYGAQLLISAGFLSSMSAHSRLSEAAAPAR